MDTDAHSSTWERQRRNLVALSIALAVYGLAGGRLNPVSFLGGGVVLNTPGTVLWIAHIAWLYLLWRYWLYSRGAHANVKSIVRSYLVGSRCYQRMVDTEIVKFQNESGVSWAEGWQKSAIQSDERTQFKPIPIDDSIQKYWFKRTLLLVVDNPDGQFCPDRKEVPLPFVKYGLCVSAARLRAAFGHHLVSDIYIPYAIAALPAFAALWQWLYV